MAARKSLSKKLRFEVFKRDSFTCQYCGKSAPDVILNVDHIKPVKNKGTNDILNLITSCFDCNSGKSARELDDQSVLKKQLSQLDELNERRIQLELMIQWRQGLKSIDDDSLTIAITEIENNINPFLVSEDYKKGINSLIKKYGLQKVLEAVDISFEQYGLNYDLCLKKIPGITKNISLPKLEQKINFITGIVSKKFQDENGSEFWKIKSIVKEYSDALIEFWDYEDEDVINDFEKQVLPMINSKFKLYHFISSLESWTNQIKSKK